MQRKPKTTNNGANSYLNECRLQEQEPNGKPNAEEQELEPKTEVQRK